MGLGEYWRSPLDPERVMHVDVTHWREREQEQREDALSVEEPFEVRIDHRSLAVIMRTPETTANWQWASCIQRESLRSPVMSWRLKTIPMPKGCLLPTSSMLYCASRGGRKTVSYRSRRLSSGTLPFPRVVVYAARTVSPTC